MDGRGRLQGAYWPMGENGKNTGSKRASDRELIVVGYFRASYWRMAVMQAGAGARPCCPCIPKEVTVAKLAHGYGEQSCPQTRL